MNNPECFIRKRQKGFTLVEVLLAVAILGIAGIALVTAASQCLAVVRSAYLYHQAHGLLQRVDLENPLFDDELQQGIESGRFPDRDLEHFTWSREINAQGTEPEGLYEVRTRISWTRQGSRGFEEVVSFRFIPPEEL